MPELIDKTVAYNALKHEAETHFLSFSAEAFGKAARIIDQMPTVTAEPVRHGRWIEKPPYKDETVKGLEFQIVCSECDEQNAEIIFDENSVPIGKTFNRSRYCPWCGAKMDEQDGGAENG